MINSRDEAAPKWYELGKKGKGRETVAEKALSGGREGVVHVTKEACDVTARYSNH